MADLTEQCRFLFGLDEPPDDIEEFFVAEAVAEEDALGLDVDDLDRADDEARRRAGMRAVVASVMLYGESPAYWETAQRLLAAGFDRRDALEQMAYAVRQGLDDQDPGSSDQLPQFLTDGVGAYLGDLPLPGEVAVVDAILDVVTTEQGIPLGLLVERVTALLAPPPGGRLTRYTVGGYLGDQLDEYGELAILPDDRIVRPLAFAAVLTHRLSAEEIESACVHGVASDLGLFALNMDPLLPDGDPLEPTVEGDDLRWSGPEGWLAGFAAGDLVAVRMDGEGVVTLAAAAEPEPAPTLAAALRTAFDTLVKHEAKAMPVSMLLSAVLLDDAQAFAAPRPPLTDLLGDVGLSIPSGRVGAEPAHFTAAEAEDRSARMHEAAEGDCSIADPAIEVYAVLTDADAPAVEIRRALRDLGGGRLPDDPGAVTIRDLVVDELVPEDSPGLEAGALREVAARAVAAARRSDEVAAAQWLAGMIAERSGDLTAAEHAFHAAMVADIGFEVAVDRCAWYASDRGDAATAVRLWDALESGFAGELSTVERYVRPAAERLGRNDPCWCGSGRKFKVCHQGRPASPPLPERVAWLASKAVSYVMRRGGEAREDLVANFLALAGMTGGAFDAPAVARVVGDPLAVDAMLHEGGWFARFLDERGPLLPDDEQLLAASWLLVERSVHEVVRVEPGAGIEMRDLRTGDVVMVTEQQLGVQAAPGMQFCCRVVPDGAGHQIVGGVFPVRVGDEQAVMAVCERADPVELCRWAGALRRPPMLQNREGEVIEGSAEPVSSPRLADLAGSAALPEGALAEVQERMEQRWLTEPVPALGGRTPIAAAADPTRRRDVERLIDSFPTFEGDAGVVGLRPEKLREALGL